jgi:peptide/nickel transport system permease protein
MVNYIIKRLLQAIVVLVVVSLLVFFIMRTLPGDPILMIISRSDMSSMNNEQIDYLRHLNGLDRPMIVQYFSWIGGLFQGDFGNSLYFNRPVNDMLLSRIPISLYLGFISFVIGNVVGITAGVISAVKRGKFVDLIITTIVNIGITAPVFWVAILLLYGFGLKLHWLPLGGWVPPIPNFWDNVKHIILPVFCLSIFVIGASARQARSSMLEVLYQDYIRTAWAKGLSEHVILMRHVLKNGLIPLVTLMGIHIGQLLGGSVLIETVFNIPGVGRLSVDAVLGRDYAIIQAIIILMAFMVIMANLIVDISYGWINPRMRYE